MTRLTCTLKGRLSNADKTVEVVCATESERIAMDLRGIAGRRRDDDGFSVVEVVFAAAILFFALTALIGLMGVSSRMTASSRARTILTNEVASQLDSARAIPFDQLALTTANPPGQLAPSLTYTKSGYTITMTFTVTDRSAVNGTKEVRVVAVIAQPGFPDVRTTAFAAVRNRIGGTTVVANSAPTIEIVSPTPDSDTIVAGNQIAGGGPLLIATRAESELFKIKRVEYLVGNTVLKNGTTIYADPAQHDFSGVNAIETWQFQWHTKQVDGSGVPSVQDGRRTVRVVAYDDQGRASAPQQRVFLVDNYPPELPQNRALAWSGFVNTSGLADQKLTAQWTNAMDGTDVAPYHFAEVYENLNGAADSAAWSAPVTMQSAGVVAGTGPFGCYAMRVEAKSPLQNSSGWGVVGPVFTRPTANGSCDVTRAYFDKKKDTWTFVTRLTAKRPRFPYNSSTVQVKVLRYDAGTAAAPVETDITAAAKAAWAGGADYTYSNTNTQTIANGSTPVPPPYRIQVTITPTGWGAAPTTLLSNYATAWYPSPISGLTYSATTKTVTVTNKPLTVAW